MDVDLTAGYNFKQLVGHGLCGFAAMGIAQTRSGVSDTAPWAPNAATLMGGTGPDALPNDTINPKRRRQASEPSQVSLPTLSYTTTPCPPVISCTLCGKALRSVIDSV